MMLLSMSVKIIISMNFFVISMNSNKKTIWNPIDDTLDRFTLTANTAESKSFIFPAHGFDVVKPPPVHGQHHAYDRGGNSLFKPARVGRKHNKPEKQDKKNKEKRKRRSVNYFRLRGKQEQQEKEKAEPQGGHHGHGAEVSSLTRDNFDGVVGPVTCTKEAGTLSIPFKHAEGYKTCVFMIDSKGYSSKEKQEGNIMVESNTTFCTLFIKHFSLKTYEHITVSVDADLDRILGPITFGKLLMDKHAAIDNCENGHDDKGLSAAAIAMIVVVVVVIIIVVIGCVLNVLKKKGIFVRVHVGRNKKR